MSSIRFLSLALLAAMAGVISHPAFATVPYTENFTSDAANWTDGSGAALATHVASGGIAGGGPDGSSYITSTASAHNIANNAAVVVFRGQDEFNSSAHAFEGDWLGSGINHFSTWVWHNAPVPLDFFVRFATASNFPGTAADKMALVAPNTWTELSYEIAPAHINEYLFPEGPNSFFNATFGSVGHIQVGYSVPTGFGSDLNSYSFALDRPSIQTPEPASLFLVISFAAAACMRRRRAS
jgi:hypothetical protein